MNDMIFLNKSVISSKQQRVCWMFISFRMYIECKMILVFMVNFDQQTTHPYVLQNLFNFLPELRLPLNFSILIFQIYGSNLEVPITLYFILTSIS